MKFDLSRAGVNYYLEFSFRSSLGVCFIFIIEYAQIKLMFDECSIGKQIEDYNVNCSKLDNNGRLELEGISKFNQHQTPADWQKHWQIN